MAASVAAASAVAASAAAALAAAASAAAAAPSAADATAAARMASAVEPPPAANPAPAWHWQSHAADGLACVVRLVSGSKTPLGYHGNELRIAVCAVCSEQKREPTAGELR